MTPKAVAKVRYQKQTAKRYGNFFAKKSRDGRNGVADNTLRKGKIPDGQGRDGGKRVLCFQRLAHQAANGLRNDGLAIRRHRSADSLHRSATGCGKSADGFPEQPVRNLCVAERGTYRTHVQPIPPGGEG